MAKYYAVQKGKIPGVYESWDECKSQIEGFKGAKYKSYKNYDDALKFVNGELDYDKKSYCDVFVKVKRYRKDPLDEQNNCNISYKLYLKCNGYEEKGYQNWG